MPIRTSLVEMKRKQAQEAGSQEAPEAGNRGRNLLRQDTAVNRGVMGSAPPPLELGTRTHRAVPAALADRGRL